MNIILCGPPGSGKGTQSDNLVSELDFIKISTGDLLRTEIKNNTSLGKKIKSLIDQGTFVSDDIINDLIINVLSNKNYENKLIFDGYPRNLKQAEKLDHLVEKYNQKISCVLSLKVDEKTIIKRILGRLVCKKCGLIFNQYFKRATKDNHVCGSVFLEKRSDDNEETIRNRFETYSKETLPILNFYQNRKILYEVNGMNEIDQIHKEIREIINSLHA